MGRKKPKKSSATNEKKRGYLSQLAFPRVTLEKALVIAQAIWENYAGKPTAPHDVALALDLSPTSGPWRSLCGSSIAYGLTAGGYRANEINLTDLGRSIVAPTNEGDDVSGKVLALLKPRIMREFYEKYDKAKFPKDNIAKNVLISLRVLKERAEKSFEIIRENGTFTGIFKQTKTGLFVALGSPTPLTPSVEEKKESPSEEQQEVPSEEEISEEAKQIQREKNNRVYISHGKNREFVNQIKELLTFGKFEPVVSVEKATTSIPVPEKVFDDMRSCSAAVIHVTSEGEVLDAQGEKHTRINENVLIEIGAAIALYKKNFVLLVEKGLGLPSNLQGLYLCEYEGDRLDYEATMKLLKIFNQFK